MQTVLTEIPSDGRSIYCMKGEKSITLKDFGKIILNAETFVTYSILGQTQE